MSLLRNLLAATTTSSLLLVASAASADVMMPGSKSVTYTFSVHGITAPERAVFAYPCGTSAGRPIDEIRLLEEGKAVSVGSRGGSCNVYVIDKAKYDEFAKTYVPDRTKMTDPNLAAFAATATKCTGAPSPRHVVSESDARTSIHEDLDLAATAGSCSVTTRSTPAPEQTSTNTVNPGDGDASGPPSSDAGGCSVGGNARTAAPWLIALAVPLLLGASRRRRKA
ncbi:MAG: hypothetical protein JST00_10685 [Deltaproteobacteria bacterium]|nr:hypothetical protein [Deltaproteobacteria bacterium]